MLDFLILIESLVTSYPKTVFTVFILFALYTLYRRRFRYYKLRDTCTQKKGRRNFGESFPAFPNGWYGVCRSNELKRGDVKHADFHGENLAVFRGNNNKVYALNAYCAHLGANLAIGGKVVNETCIRCPFHGWIFDGETGNSKIGDKTREATLIEYENCDGELTMKTGPKQQIKQQKFPCIERCGWIFVYFDQSPEYKETGKIHYEPVDISEYLKNVEPRGQLISLMNSHMTELFANTADQAHLDLVHPKFIPFLTNYWCNVKFVHGDDPKILDALKNEVPEYYEFRQKLYKTFFKEENKKYLTINTFDYKVSIGSSTKQHHLYCGTAIQVGSGLIYLFLKGKGWDLVWTAYVQPFDINLLEAHQDFYVSKWMPYFLSAFFIKQSQSLLKEDSFILDNKKSAFRINLSDNPFDDMIGKWYQWHNQFNVGCVEYEKQKKNENLDW